MGKSILESYALGRPVVASDLGSRREVVIHRKTGLLFQSVNVEQLADAISFLYDRPELALEMGSAGRDMVRERHTPEAHYRAVLRIYEDLSKNKPPRRTKTISQAIPTPHLRVAFIGGRGVISKYSGIESYYEEVGRRLAEMGHDVTVYCRTYFTSAIEEHNGMRLVRLPTIRSKHLETLVHTLLSTIHALFSGSQIVHYHALGPALFSFLPRLIGKKTAVRVTQTTTPVNCASIRAIGFGCSTGSQATRWRNCSRMRCCLFCLQTWKACRSPCSTRWEPVYAC